VFYSFRKCTVLLHCYCQWQTASVPLALLAVAENLNFMNFLTETKWSDLKLYGLREV